MRLLNQVYSTLNKPELTKSYALPSIRIKQYHFLRAEHIAILPAAYNRAIDMSIDKFKESQHWGEAPEYESYQEEIMKEYLFDKIRESGNE